MRLGDVIFELTIKLNILRFSLFFFVVVVEKIDQKTKQNRTKTKQTNATKVLHLAAGSWPHLKFMNKFRAY